MIRKEISKKIVADLKELAALTSDENGAQRVAWTPVWQKAVEWFREKMLAAGAEVWLDAAGNIWAKFAGEKEEAIVIGSHIDSVPDGGWLDGALGVVAGMGIGAYGLAGKKPQNTLYVVGWADEEGAVFGKSCLGSGICAGCVVPEDLLPLKNKDGEDFASVWKRVNLTPEKMTEAHAAFSMIPIKAYLELHIEQAPLLAMAKKSVACVYGVCGCHRQYITFRGQQGHCGSPVALRKDAFIAAAQASLDFREIALKYDSYCTVGNIELHPNVPTISPGQCRISLDLRCIDSEKFAQMIREAKAACEKRAAENNLEVSFEELWHKEPILFDAKLAADCKAAVAEEVGEEHSMYSAPLHDAVEMNKVVPSIMMFTQSDPGISHCKEEDTPIPALEEAISAFIRLAEKELQVTISE